MGLVLVLLDLAGSAHAAPPQVLYVGDSLGVGTTPGLARELGSSARVHGDSRIGRPSGEGLRVLGQTINPADDIVVFDLGSNDDLAQPRVLASNLAGARRVAGDRCLIVATLNRPPFNGVPIDGLNQAVLAFASAARNVHLVDWNAIAQSEPAVLGPDGVHPTPQGYALRAQLFAEAVVACSQAPAEPGSLASPQPEPKDQPRPHRPERRIKVPGIESSGVSFTEPVRVRGVDGQLLLPNTKPPYPAVVMLGGSQAQAEFLAAHGIATLVWVASGRSAADRVASGRSAADAPAADSRATIARAAVALLAGRDDIRRDGIALWGFGSDAERAADAAAGNRSVAAVVAVSPAPIAAASLRAWHARRAADAPAASTWLRVRERSDEDPAATWERMKQPLLAIWGTRDEQIPIHASADALKHALEAGANVDRTFRWFDAGHPATAPGMLEEAARWLGLHLGEKRARPVVNTPLPPANGPHVEDVADSSAVYTPPLQAIWLLAPLLMLVAAARRRESARAASARLCFAAAAAGIGCAAAIAAGVALGLHAERPMTTVAGTPWPFALAWICVGALAAAAIALARRRAFLGAAAASAWLGLALFWLV